MLLNAKNKATNERLTNKALKNFRDRPYRILANCRVAWFRNGTCKASSYYFLTGALQMSSDAFFNVVEGVPETLSAMASSPPRWERSQDDQQPAP